MHKTKFKQTEIGMIPEEWEVGHISDLVRVKAGYAFKSSDFTNHGIGVIKIKNINDGTVDLINTDKISNDLFNSLSNDFVLSTGDVVIAMTGATIGKVGKLRDTDKKYVLNQRVARFISNNKADLEFVFQYTKTKDWIDSINNYANGAAQQNISADGIASIAIPIPPENERKQIAEILSSFDDKIELNQQMNKTLEEIGKAIFKHWFVDFEFQNEEGKPYKSSGGEMVYNEELGKEIPKVWEVSNIGKELKTILGGTPSRERKEYWINGNIPWINSGEINKFPIIDATEYITPDALKNSATQLMPKRTVVLPFVISINKQISISILGTEVCGNQSVLGIVEKQGLPSEYIYYWVEHMKKDIYSWATGGAQQHINKTNVDKTKILIPSKDVMQNYSRIVRQIFDLVIKNSLEVKTLSQIRDVLLPKLMSGKIRVPLEEENG